MQNSKMGKIVIPLVVWIFSCFGCATTMEWEQARPVSLAKPDVIVPLTDAISKKDTLCIAPFSGHNMSQEWLNKISREYENAVIKRNIVGFSRHIEFYRNDLHIFLQEAKKIGCSVLLYGKVAKISPTGGGQTQGIMLETWIWKIPENVSIMHLKQSGFSRPGGSRDWFWSSSVGKPAAPLASIVHRLAEQFADILRKESKRIAKSREKLEKDSLKSVVGTNE